MSLPDRFEAADLRCDACQSNTDFYGIMKTHDKGRWVKYDDYSALAAENERLRQHKYTPQEIESIRADIDKLHAEFNRNLFKKVCAENERLRKAGDAMSVRLAIVDYKHGGNYRDQWETAKKLAAKEGRDAK